MSMLHGIWWSSRFHLWGEPSPPSAASSGRSRLNLPPEIPATLPLDELHAALGDISPDALLASAAAESTLWLWLPISGENGFPAIAEAAAPEPSAEPAVEKPLTRLGLFEIPVLSLSAAEAIDLLIGLPPDLPSATPINDAAPSVDGAADQAHGDSLRYWRGLAKFVVSLLARQQFVPDLLLQSNGRHAGQWRPFIRDREELQWLEHYAAAMPIVCRAATDPNVPTFQPADPSRIVDDFLLQATDALIRRNLSHDPFYDQIHRRAAREKMWELRWLSSLVGMNPSIDAPPEQTAAHAAPIRNWISRVEKGRRDKLPDLAFTLLEPDEAEEDDHARWRVQFDLLSEDGQTLDLQRLWEDDRDALVILGRHLVGRREHLMAELARAAEIFPPLRGLTRPKQPPAASRSAEEETSPLIKPLSPLANHVELSTAQAQAFLNEWSPMLRAHGYRVTVPDWALRSDLRLGLELHVRPEDEPGESREVSISSMGLSSLLAFDWRVAVGDEQLSIHEFKKIAASTAPLVRIRGQWVNIDRDAARQALDFLRRGHSGKLTLAEAIRLASGMEDLNVGLPIVGLRGASWVERFLADPTESRMETLPQPQGFRGELRHYQRTGLNWLAFLDRLSIGACLADDMGLGKTIELIALLLHERTMAASLIGPTLLFAPMSVVGNWEREIQRFAPSLKVLIHHGPERLSGTAFAEAAQEHDIVITTYGLAQRDFKSLSRIFWYRVVLDEAQKIKNPSANQTIAIRALGARQHIAMTGTPVENHLSELWSIMEVLNPGLLGGASAFRNRFAVPIEKLGDRERAAELRRVIRPFILRRVKTDPRVISDLPEKMEMRVYCNLTPEQAAHYERTVNTMLREVEVAGGIRRRGLILAAITRLKQVCNHPAQLLGERNSLDGRSGKCERLVEMLEEMLEEGESGLVFTQFRQMGDLLHRLITERLRTKIFFLHGGTPARERDRMITGFQNPASEERIFLLSLKAGGFGLNLTRASHVFHFDRWWNPAVEDQATDRAYRIGQTRRVQVYKFVCIGTIEDRIDQLLTEKSALAEQVVGGGEEWLTGLSTTELREYLRLSRDAVAET